MGTSPQPPDDRPALDPDELKRFGFAVWSYKMGEQVSLMIHLATVSGSTGPWLAPARSRSTSSPRRPA